MWPGAAAVATAEEGRKAVRDAKEYGADFIKVYSMLSRDNYLAIAAEAKAQGLPFAGHVPLAVSAREASDVGQKSLEHLYGIEKACSSEADEIDAIEKKFFEAMIMGLKPKEIFAIGKSYHDRLIATYSDDRAAELFTHFKRNGTWVCPTLTFLRATASLKDAAFTADPRLKYVSPVDAIILGPEDRLPPRPHRGGRGVRRGTLAIKDEAKLRIPARRSLRRDADVLRARPHHGR